MSVHATRSPPTTAEILARQKQRVESERRPVAQPAQSTALAVQSGRSPLNMYLDEIAPSSFSGQLVKFNKDGKFVVSSTGDMIDENADFIAMCDEVLVGWIKFNGENAPPDRIQGLLFDGFVMPARETLGDLDEAQWEKGLSGQPQDPWLHQMSIVLQETASLEIFTFSTTSATGRRAVGNLLRHYERLRRADASLYPIVRLKSGGFHHKDPRVGWVATPQFVVVGKAPKDSAAKPDSSVASDMNDDLPF
jgi:hypothetical protein